MPPVLGPASPSSARLKSCAGARATARRPSHTASTDSSGPTMPSSITTRAAGVAEAGAGELGPHVVLGVDEVVGDQHALAGGEAVGLDHPRRRQRPQEVEGGLDVGEGAVGGGGHAGGGHHLLHPRLRALEAGAVGARAEDQPRRRRAGGRRGPSTSGASGPTTTRSARRARSIGGTGVQAMPAAAMPGLPGRDDHLGGAGQHVGQGVLPPPGPDDDDLHAALDRPTAQRSGGARGRRRRS